jgi:hypothetical protein
VAVMAVPKGRHQTSHELIIRWFSDAMLGHEAKGRRRASHELIVDREKRVKEKGVQRQCSVPFYIWQGDEGEGGPSLLHHVEGGWGGNDNGRQRGTRPTSDGRGRCAAWGWHAPTGDFKTRAEEADPWAP